MLKTISRAYRLLNYKLSSLLGPNLAILREVGMSDYLISYFLRNWPTALLSLPARLKVQVDRARDAGFDPKRHGFILATSALGANYSDITWGQKVELFTKWGWSDDEVIYAFKKCPQFMMASEKKCNAVMDYVVNIFCCEKTPCCLLIVSRGGSIIPRWSIIQHLLYTYAEVWENTSRALRFIYSV